MALIKCNECGNEISDKSITCIHCGCPIQTKEKKYCLECGNEIKNGEKSCSYCGCPIEENKDYNINTNSIIYDGKQEVQIAQLNINFEKIEKYQSIFIVLGILFCLTIFGIPAGIVFFSIAIFYGRCKRNHIVLTNKRIRGIIKLFWTTESIDIPLDKIDSISCGYLFNYERLIITSNTRRRQVNFSMNTEEFCENVLQEIEKYKKYVYRKEY